MLNEMVRNVEEASGHALSQNRFYSLAMCCPTPSSLNSPPRGIIVIGVFLLFGAAMALLAGITLVRTGTVLDYAWTLNPRAYKQLAPLGRPVGILLLVLAVGLGVAGIGWLRRRKWGWGLAVAIISTQVLGDLVNALRGEVIQGSVGIVLAGALLLYMTRPHVRRMFGTKRN